MLLGYETINNQVYYKHKIEAGENLSSICHIYYIQNLRSVLAIYNDPVNMQFKSLFPNPSKIKTGSIFFIPVQPIESHKNNCFILGCSTCPLFYKSDLYDQKTFDLIQNLSNMICHYSSIYAVPPIAVAGSIADEYNVRRGKKGAFDWFQDNVLLNFMPNFAIKLDSFFNNDSKLLNATKHDIGIGNINVATAKQIYEEYNNFFVHKNWSYSDIIDYIRTNEGTIHFATLVIKQANEKLEQYILDYPDYKKEAVLITYYKQGEKKYIQRFLKKLTEDPSARIRPGEGCRVCNQRIIFLSILNMLPDTGLNKV